MFSLFVFSFLFSKTTDSYFFTDYTMITTIKLCFVLLGHELGMDDAMTDDTTPASHTPLC